VGRDRENILTCVYIYRKIIFKSQEPSRKVKSFVEDLKHSTVLHALKSWLLGIGWYHNRENHMKEKSLKILFSRTTGPEIFLALQLQGRRKQFKKGRQNNFPTPKLKTS
jgi:hypothetical protein